MDHKGMSLVEIVVSMLVLAVAALGVTATISLVNSKQMRSASGGSLDLQAAGFARQTLGELKNAVSANTTTSARLTGSSAGVDYIPVADTSLPGAVVDPTLVLPAGNLASHAGKRTYKVWDIDANSDGTPDYKKVTASVTWTD